MTTTETKAESKITVEMFEPYVEALLRASGITEEQARLCVLYAICTFRDDLKRIPILAIMGKTGTGKSTLLEQLSRMVKEPKKSTASSRATMRDEIDNCPTYLIDEGDKVSETLLQKRTDKSHSIITHNVGTGHGWEKAPAHVFGATIIARRNPFRDSAVRNRAIVIHTKHNPGDYVITHTEDLQSISQRLSIEKIALGSGRVKDTYTPLLEVAKAIGKPEWEKAVESAIDHDERIFSSGQQYEAEEIILQALDKSTWDGESDQRLDTDVELMVITKEACDIGDVKLTKKQVEELLLSKGFNVTYTHGVKLVRSNTELLESLLTGV